MTIKNQSRRNFLFATAGVSCGLLLPASVQAGNIGELKGTVYINKRIATPLSTIKAGDLVTSSMGSSISFKIGNDAFMLKDQTSLEVASQDGFFIDTLRLLTGKLLSVFETGRHRQIVTTNATIGIRGTACFLNTSPSKLYYCNCYGTTELKTKDYRQEFTATHHNAHILEFESDKMMGMAATSVLDHTDDELRALEKMVGRIPKFDQT